MLLLRHNTDLDASSLRLRSSSYPSYNTIPSRPFTHSPSEEVLSNYREQSLVDPWLPSPAGASADVSHPADISSTLPKSTYSPPINDPRFHHSPGGSPSPRHPSFPSQQQHPGGSLNRHLSEPNIRSVAAQPASHHPLSETRYQQRRQQHRQSFQHSVTPAIPSPSSAAASFSADRRPSTAGSAASSGWGGEPLQEVTGVTSGHDLPENASPVERYHSAFSNPFSDHSLVTRHSPASSLVPIVRSVGSEEEHDAVPTDSSLSKTYSFVSLPGNAVRKRPRRRYDEIERLYHCSWTGCTKSYGTLNHLNAHIVMQRHGSKRTPAEFKELRKQWRKAKKDESERIARLERAEERFNMRSEHAAMQYPPQSYERQPRHLSYARLQLYGPGIPGPEMDQQQAVGEAVPRYPLSAETSSMRPQPLHQQYGYTMSGAAHSLYPVVPATPIPSSWPEPSTQYEGATPPQQGGPAPGHAHIPAQAAYDYERERQGQSWTHSSRPVASFDVSPSYTQPQPQQRVNTLPPDSTLLTPLPGYQPQPPAAEPEYEEEYESKQQFWSEQQQQQQQQQH